MFQRIHLQPSYAPADSGGPAVAAPETLREFTTALESIRRQVQADIIEIRALHEALGALRQADALIQASVGRLETQMDNLPARVSDLEKYGSEHIIKLEPQMDALLTRIKELEGKPDQQRNRLLIWIAGLGCAFSGLSVVAFIFFSAVGVLLSIYLARQ